MTPFQLDGPPSTTRLPYTIRIPLPTRGLAVLNVAVPPVDVTSMMIICICGSGFGNAVTEVTLMSAIVVRSDWVATPNTAVIGNVPAATPYAGVPESVAPAPTSGLALMVEATPRP